MDRPIFNDEPDDYFADDDDSCTDCGGEGWVVTCCDDLCHSAGYCIHGDGMMLCHCNQHAEKCAPDNAPANWRAPRNLKVKKKG